MKNIGLYAAALFLCACAREGAAEPNSTSAISSKAAESPPAAPVDTSAPAGRYTLDKAHASLTFTVDHIGFSDYTGQFDSFDATLDFDPDAPERMAVSATIDPFSLDVPSPPDGFLDELTGPSWLDAGAHPKIEFRSTSVVLTAPDTARVDGELTLRGVSGPVTMQVRFRGGYAGFPPYDMNARIGFSASGAISRSAFGMTFGLPGEGFEVGVGDAVSFAIEAEFSGPPTATP